MQRKKLTGWQKVFRFTFSQSIKNKAFLITAIILCAVCLLGLPTFLLLQGALETGDAQAGQTESVGYAAIHTVYLVNETGLDISTASWAALDVDSVEETADAQVVESDANGVSVTLYIDGTSIYMEFARPTESEVTDLQMDAFISAFSEVWDGQLPGILGVSAEQMAIMHTVITVENRTYTLSDHGEVVLQQGEEDTISNLSMTQYNVVLMALVGMILFITLSGEYVASSIVTEKANRVVEYLLVTVSPLALVVGKVAAVFLVVMSMLLTAGACLAVSMGVSSFFLADQMQGMLESLPTGTGWQEILPSPGHLILGLLLLFTGLIFYDLLAGLFGATVSRVEEMAEGMKLFTLILLLGVYLSIFILMNDTFSGESLSPAKIFGILFPLSAPFLTTAYLFMGKISLIWGAVSLGLLLAALVLLFLFVSHVYGALIYHKGNPIKIKGLWALFLEERSKTGRKENLS